MAVGNLPVLTGLQMVLEAGSGSLVGFMLGLVGGGGSILAVPLMIYVVGVHDPHVAIGTSALAVAANAAVGLFHHARQRNVIWHCGGMGFFGIGGGFLVVPGLVGSTGMPMLNAVGTSLVAVTAFGLTTSLNYALSGLVDWPLAGVFIAGGAMGSLIGARVAKRLAGTAGRLTTVFAIVILIVAAYMLWRGSHA